MLKSVILLVLCLDILQSASVDKKDRVVREKKLSDKEHFAGDDHEHDFDYDHEAFLGHDEAREFDQLPPEESKSRLGE